MLALERGGRDTQLSLEYEPKVQSWLVGFLMSILSCSFEGGIPAKAPKISEFARKIKEYEQQ